MSEPTLRPYQTAMVEATRAAYAAGHRRVLLTAPTGAGKTVTFAYVVHGARERGNRVCVLVHREELLDQVSDTLRAFNVPHAVIAAGRPLTNEPVQVASVFTLSRRLRSAACPRFDLLVIDEAHHTVAGSWARVTEHYANARVLGVTATPVRLDGRGLARHYDSLVSGPDIGQLVGLGYLSPAVHYHPPGQVDAAGLRTRCGDFDRSALAERASAITGDVVAHYTRHATGLQAVAFCVTLAHAAVVRDQFRAAGIDAEVIDGGMTRQERRALVDRFRRREVRVLASCDLISEGFDCPSIEAAILLRPTQSLAVYLQQIGRALRPSPGKTHAVILDHAGNVMRHGPHDTPREWALTNDKPAKVKPPALRTCMQCYAIAPAPATVCPLCGTPFGGAGKARELPAVRRGELVTGGVRRLNRTDPEALADLTATYREQLRTCRTVEDLEAMARQRGYSPGWVRRMWGYKSGAAYGRGGQR